MLLKTEIFRRMVITEHTDNNAGNPSQRRDGIAISFWCEQCGAGAKGHPGLTLTVAQEKGSTEIVWRIEP
jgi:hypothetical protein